MLSTRGGSLWSDVLIVYFGVVGELKTHLSNQMDVAPSQSAHLTRESFRVLKRRFGYQVLAYLHMLLLKSHLLDLSGDQIEVEVAGNYTLLKGLVKSRGPF